MSNYSDSQRDLDHYLTARVRIAVCRAIVQIIFPGTNELSVVSL